MKRSMWVAGLVVSAGMGPAVGKAYADGQDRPERAHPAGGMREPHEQVVAPAREVGGVADHEAATPGAGTDTLRAGQARTQLAPSTMVKPVRAPAPVKPNGKYRAQPPVPTNPRRPEPPPPPAMGNQSQGGASPSAGNGAVGVPGPRAPLPPPRKMAPDPRPHHPVPPEPPAPAR